MLCPAFLNTLVKDSSYVKISALCAALEGYNRNEVTWIGHASYNAFQPNGLVSRPTYTHVLMYLIK
jgi:hypothetical protein